MRHFKSKLPLKAYLENVTALVVLQSPPVAFENLNDVVLGQDRKEPVQQDLQPHGNGTHSIKDQRGYIVNDVGRHSLNSEWGHAGGWRGQR